MTMNVYYTDENVNIKLGEVYTNRSLTMEEALYALGIDMDDFADEHGWDGWDYDALNFVLE